jgi:phage terminase small subunit
MVTNAEQLNPKEDSFCIHYTTIGTETYSNGTRSAMEAGYAEKSAHTSAWKLLKRPAIRERVLELHTENMRRNMITVDKVLADIEHDKILARQKGDIASALRADELQGKYLAMFVERSQVETAEEVKQLTDKQQEEARRIAAILLRQGERIAPQTATAQL